MELSNRLTNFNLFFDSFIHTCSCSCHPCLLWIPTQPPISPLSGKSLHPFGVLLFCESLNLTRAVSMMTCLEPTTGVQWTYQWLTNCKGCVPLLQSPPVTNSLGWRGRTLPSLTEPMSLLTGQLHAAKAPVELCCVVLQLCCWYRARG